MSREPLLYGSPDERGETILALALFELFLELRCKHVQKLGISSNERAPRITGAKHDRIAGNSANDGAAEMTLDSLAVGTGLHQLNT